MLVKKIALIAVATLGLAACTGGDDAANNTAENSAAVDYNVTTDNAVTDVNTAAADAGALNAADAELDHAAQSVENAGEAVANTAE